MPDRNDNSRSLFLRTSIVATLLTLTVTLLHGDESVQYPEGFRRWVHVGTGVMLPGGNPLLKSEEGMHHVFANSIAADAYATGMFPDGSILVYELRDAQQKNGVITEGDCRRVDVMIKDSKSYRSTGGWRFERFFGDQSTENAIHDSGNSCFQCHSKADKHGFVFSQLH